jgi:hypothetical protein
MQALNSIEEEIAIKTDLSFFPRSISLFQYFLAILVKKKVMLLPESARYYCNISEELLQIYPELNIAKFRFDYETSNLG